MLVHSRTLHHLYPEQQWLDNLQDARARKDAAGSRKANVSVNEQETQPKPCKANTTAYTLRRMQSREDLPTVFSHLKDFLELYRAA